MKEAIDILQKRLSDMQVAQHSEELTMYCNSIKLAIRVLENYDKVLQKTIQDQLDKQSS